MASVQDPIYECLRSSSRPLTTIEIMDRLYPDTPVWQRYNNRSRVYTALHRLEKKKIVKKGAMLDNERLWVIV